MHIIKLPWFGHKADNKQVECYSVSINSDGSRLASGGLDGNVKIWDTHTILQFKKLSEVQSKKKPLDSLDLPPKSLCRPLCSMSRHNGVVTSVKFSPDGRFLASGSDDKIVLIWEKDEEQSNRPKKFGESEADIEHWTVRKRLVAHDNDIQDICWSPDGSLLVTVGLDRSIIIWNGLTFERIKRYDIHQSMVKGIVFDPANKYFATASDDRTVRIFRYYKKVNEFNNYEFQMEHIVIDPFKKSPLTSYFRRMSWSPDGQHIAVPNATNGPVTSIAIINRGNWGTDVSLIGHEAPCEVCSFSPRLFELEDEKKSKNEDGNFTTILATAGQDQTLAIWCTSKGRPLVVAQDIAGNAITDICWAPDGETLYFSCLDGSITCVSFELNELGKVVSEDMNDLQLHRYGADRESTIFPESVEQLILEEKSESKQFKDDRQSTKPVNLIETKPKTQLPLVTKEAEEPIINNLTPKQVDKLTQSITITKSGKKRITPLLVSSSSKSSVSTLSINRFASGKKFQINSKISQPSYYLPRLGIQTSVNGIKSKDVSNYYLVNQNHEDQDNDNEDMGIDDTSSNINQSNLSGASLKRQRNKIKRLIMELRYPNCFKLISNLPESLFNNQSILNNEINLILNGSKETSSDVINSISIDVDEDLLFSVIVNSIKHFPDSKFTEEELKFMTSTIEIRNGQSWKIDDDDFEYNDKIDFQDPTTVIVSNSLDNERRKFILYFPFKIQHVLPIKLKNLLLYYVLVSFNGTLQIILAESGNYLCPSFEMGENVVMVKQRDEYLMVLTNSGLIYTWNLSINQSKLECIVKGVSISPILNNINVPETDKSSKKLPQITLPNIKIIEINPKDGSPFVMLENSNNIYNYSINLMSWILVVDSWYYQSLNEKYELINKTNTVLDSMVFKSFKNFKNDLKKRMLNNYIFIDKNTDLQDIMKTRFNEVMESFN